MFEGESYLLGDAFYLVPVSAYWRQYGGREKKQKRGDGGRDGGIKGGRKERDEWTGG